MCANKDPERTITKEFSMFYPSEVRFSCNNEPKTKMGATTIGYPR